VSHGHTQMETKFLRLRMLVECGLPTRQLAGLLVGGMRRFRLYYLVMLVNVPCVILRANRTIDLVFW
jgi:hypothetical protein